MPALFPGSVRIFTPKVDLVDTVMASHVNLLQDEMTAVQTTLGTGLLSSSWAGSYSNPSTHASLAARLQNAEAGVRAGETSLQSAVTSLTTEINTRAPAVITRNPQTDSYTLVLSDSGKQVEISSTSATTLTVPADGAVNFPVGTAVIIVQTNTGQITVSGASGVTVNATPGTKLFTRWSVASLVKRGANLWLLAGDLRE